MNEIVSSDLSRFGYRELDMAGDLLKAYAEQPIEIGDGLKLMMNTNSGNVFLTNDDCRVLMMNGDKLEEFYSCPICGHEGFLEDMEHEGNKECQEYIKSIKEN